MLAKLSVRLPNWLGDTVMAVPALSALREAAGGEVLLAGPWAALLARQGLADVLVSYPRSWGGRLRAADAVRSFRAETAVVFPHSFEAALAAVYWGARRRAGFAVGARTWLLTDRVPLPIPRGHQVDEYLLLVERLGIVPRTREPRLAPPDPASEERQAVHDALQAAGAPARGSGGRRVAIHLGAAYGSSKVWPVRRVVDLCRLLSGDGAVPVLLGSPDDLARVSSVAEKTGAVHLVGRDRPELLPALLSEMDVLVSGDTGVAHLAAALGTPVVTLFGPTDPALTAPRGKAAVVRHPVPCAPCFYRTCPIDHPCMESLEAEEVRERAHALLAACA